MENIQFSLKEDLDDGVVDGSHNFDGGKGYEEVHQICVLWVSDRSPKRSKSYQMPSWRLLGIILKH